MKVFEISLIVISALLILSTLICGMWIRSAVPNQTPESIRFHFQIGLATVLTTLLTLTVGCVRALRM
jgi:hypothetical protein